MDVSEKRDEIRVRFHYYGFIAPLKDMAGTMSRTIDPRGVALGDVLKDG